MVTQLQKLSETLGKEPSMMMEVRELLKVVSTKEELKQLVEAIIKHLKDKEQELNTAIREAKASLETKSKQLKTDLETTANKLKEQNTTAEKNLLAKLEGGLNALRTEIGYVESLIEDYDDSELRDMIESVRGEIPTIPEQFDPTEILQTQEQHTKDIEELKKRPIGRGGGITDSALKYALARIVQTVTPTGTINGSNTDFTVPSTIHAVLGFELNSRSIDPGTYTITGQKRMGITFDTAPPASYSGKQFTINYI